MRGRTEGAGKKLVRECLARMGYTINRIDSRKEASESTKLVSPNIPGWFSVKEAEALYLLTASTTATRLLEVGHFLGRSTSAICEGIRDAGLAVEFNSYDLGFRSAEDFVAHYKQVHDTILIDVPPEYSELVLSQQKTTSELAKANLARFGLDGFVNLISGDFTVLDQSLYGFIFCDAMHDRGEIRVNLPHVIAASADDCLWAFHDMYADTVGDVLERTSARLIRVVDTLGVFRFRRQTSSDRPAYAG